LLFVESAFAVAVAVRSHHHKSRHPGAKRRTTVLAVAFAVVFA